MGLAVFFDLDGTLLPMDQDEFMKEYFRLLTKKLAPFGYEPDKLVRSIMHGTAAMVNNNGSKTNETVFWEDFTRIYGENARSHETLFADFYEREFQQIKNVCGFNPKANEIVKRVREKGIPVALATNPVFPEIATVSRIRWAGLDPDDFEFYTTYENSTYCKPNIGYYRELHQKIGETAIRCTMIGNDVDEDMIAEQLGMKVFLLTDCLINKNNADISQFPNGNFDDLCAFLK